MGLGITLGSLVSAVADRTGDDSSDAVVKIKRSVNECGPDFCEIMDFPFLREDISFNIGSSNYKYSGASYLPTTYKKIVAGHLEDSNADRSDLIQVGIEKSHLWMNPNDNQGRPDEFCVTRIESGYWEIQFNKLPDDTYTVYFDIAKQWSDVSDNDDETVITRPYIRQFATFVAMDILGRQGDSETLITLQNDWWDPRNPQRSMLGRMLGSNRTAMKRKRLKVWPPISDPHNQRNTETDYNFYRQTRRRY